MFTTETKAKMSDGFLQILLDIHVQYNIYSKDFCSLLAEKLKRNEIE